MAVALGTNAASVSRSGDDLRRVALIGLAALIVILVAWAYEIFGGLTPCPLCLKQRWAYYFAIPAAFAIPLVFRNLRDGPGALLLAFIALAFAANAVLAGYHSGVEWKWWTGPTACSSGAGEDLAVNATSLLDDLQTDRVVRCDEAAWRFFGLSFAGWNVLISMGLSLAAAIVLRRQFRDVSR